MTQVFRNGLTFDAIAGRERRVGNGQRRTAKHRVLKIKNRDAVIKAVELRGQRIIRMGESFQSEALARKSRFSDAHKRTKLSGEAIEAGPK